MIKRQRVQRDLTRPAGVRVDGPLARGLWPPAGGGLCIAGAQGATALRAEGCGIALAGDEYEVRGTGFSFSTI